MQVPSGVFGGDRGGGDSVNFKWLLGPHEHSAEQIPDHGSGPPERPNRFLIFTIDAPDAR